MEKRYTVRYRTPDGEMYSVLVKAGKATEAAEKVEDWLCDKFPQEDPDARPRWLVEHPDEPDDTNRVQHLRDELEVLLAKKGRNRSWTRKDVLRESELKVRIIRTEAEEAGIPWSDVIGAL